MATEGMTVLVEMPNLSSAVRMFHKLDDVSSLLSLIGDTCPFFEISRMTAFRNNKALEKTDKLLFGEHLVVKYKYEDLDRVDPKVELEKVLDKMKDIDVILQILSTQNECLLDQEQQNPNIKGLSVGIGSDFSFEEGYESSDSVYYGKDMPLPVIRVKLPGADGSAVIAPGPDRDSKERFRRIFDTNIQGIYFKKYKAGYPTSSLESMTKEQLEETFGIYPALESSGSEEDGSGVSRTTESFIPDEEIPQLKI
ncbi:hypothetical protein TWF102_010155 [Orbilia oligospora]|uniref:Uncharacterized protein n=1 Tax=Orbilia oligospora TaxID=2813651 RepID=A0A7C8J1V6_ORBOL|nr:hypothetical protein TWF102_010155 [Orbilia oligospora]KAF3093282.1 hypothetical protein TWF103_011035 [Orbilia oligospora]KAF3129171.1 hypothetical protein TWF703_009015 [Orbilia oligospora]